MFWQPGRRRRDDVIGVLPLPNVGLHVTRFVAARFGSDRGARRTRLLRRGGPRCSACAPSAAFARRRAPGLGALGAAGHGAARSRALDPRGEAALAEVIRAKGGRRESDFVRLFDAHPKLRRAIRRLAQDAIG